MSLKRLKPVRISPSKQPPLLPEKTAVVKTDSISEGLNRIVAAENNNKSTAEKKSEKPSNRSHTDKESLCEKQPADNRPDAAIPDAKPEALPDGPDSPVAQCISHSTKQITPTGLHRTLDEVMKDRIRSKNSRRSQMAAAKMATPPESPLPDAASTKETEEEVKESAKESAKDSNTPKKRSKKYRIIGTPPLIPTDSRSCVDKDFLALYDRLIQEEQKEFETKCRRKITIRFAIIFGATTGCLLLVIITLIVLLATKKCK